LVERPDDRGNHIHQIELLSLHIGREQFSSIGSEFEKSGIGLRIFAGPAICRRIDLRTTSTCSGVIINDPAAARAWRQATLIHALRECP
jgi:hypothetical protein